jgi:hypothetical protein
MKKLSIGNKSVNIGIALALLGVLIFSLVMVPSLEGLDASPPTPTPATTQAITTTPEITTAITTPTPEITTTIPTPITPTTPLQQLPESSDPLYRQKIAVINATKVAEAARERVKNGQNIIQNIKLNISTATTNQKNSIDNTNRITANLAKLNERYAQVVGMLVDATKRREIAESDLIKATKNLEAAGRTVSSSSIPTVASPTVAPLTASNIVEPFNSRL